MIRIYRSVGNEVRQIDKIEENCWIHLSAPEPGELSRLSAELSIPLEFLTDPLDSDERSRIDMEDNCLLVIFRTAIRDPANPDIPYQTIPMGVILKGEIKITICLHDPELLSDLCAGKMKHFHTGSRNVFLLHLLHRTSYFYLKYLEDIDARTNAIENELQKSTKNEELIKLLNLEKSLVFFTTSLKSNELMIQRLVKVKFLAFTEDDLDFLEDAVIDNRQAIDVAEIYSNILSGMMDAFASVISNNLNIVMKFLTAVTLILMIPTVIASFYGMNVGLPGQHSPHAFVLIILSSIMLSIAGVWFFIKKRWL